MLDCDWSSDVCSSDLLTLLKEMKRRNLNLGLATLCVGGGQGAAVVVER
jgi:acetyl-CoA acetyltransferase